MAVGFLDLPAEIRTIVYRELFQSSPIVCHQDKDTWEEASDGESETESDDAEMNESLSSDEADEDDSMTSQVDQPSPEETCLAILRTCRTVNQEAKAEFYAHTPFTIENRVGHYIDRLKFQIDQRIQHLTIEQEPEIDLWTETTSFLKRHFSGRDVALRELAVSGDAFEEDAEQELNEFLKATLPHVEKLSFLMDVYGDPRIDPVGNITHVSSSRQCQVEISRRHGTAVVVRSADEADYEEVRERLLDTRAIPHRQRAFRWVPVNQSPGSNI